MDHVNVNRFALSALGAVLFVMLLTAFSNLVLSPRTPKVPGFALPTSGPATADRRGAQGGARRRRCRRCSPRPTSKRANTTSRSARPATISRKARAPRSGRICGTWSGVRSRRSRASSIPIDLKKIGGDWTYDKLNAWITDPKAMAPDTKMAFAGEKDATEAGRHPRLSAHALRQAGPAPEVRAGPLEAVNSTKARVGCKEIQTNARKIACISLDSFGRFEPFQRVTQKKIKKFAAGPTRVRGCAKRPAAWYLLALGHDPLGACLLSPGRARRL